jgi:hypothetical protein
MRERGHWRYEPTAGGGFDLYLRTPHDAGCAAEWKHVLFVPREDVEDVVTLLAELRRPT